MKKLVSFIIVTGILMSLTGCGKGKTFCCACCGYE